MSSAIRLRGHGGVAFEVKPLEIQNAEFQELTSRGDLTQAQYIDFQAFSRQLVDSPYTYGLMSRAGRIYGLKSGDNTVAVMQYMYPTRPEEGLLLASLSVIEKLRGMELAERFLTEAEREAEKLGIDRLWATVRHDNSPIIVSVINKMGYTGVEFHRDYYGKDENRFIIEKRLSMPVEKLGEAAVGGLIRDGKIPVIGQRDVPGSDTVAARQSDLDSIERVMGRGYELNLLVRGEHYGSSEDENLLVFSRRRKPRVEVARALPHIPSEIDGHTLSFLSGAGDCVEATNLGVNHSTTDPRVCSMRMLSEAGFLMGVRDREQLIGYEGILFNPRGESYVYGPVLHGDYRKTGLAGRLIELAEGIARGHGDEYLNSIIPINDPTLVAAYNTRGYEGTELVPGVMEDKADAVVMRKNLR